MSLATEQFNLVVEGEATLITDPATVADMAARWAAGGWQARVDDTGVALTAEFSAPSAGPPPWHVYRLTPKTATALATVDPGGATRLAVLAARPASRCHLSGTVARTSADGPAAATSTCGAAASAARSAAACECPAVDVRRMSRRIDRAPGGQLVAGAGAGSSELRALPR